MLMRIFVILIVLAALIIGVSVLILPREEILKVIIFRDFFDVSLPILGFGALIKYLCTLRPTCHLQDCQKCNK